jgi:hypothetical protein
MDIREQVDDVEERTFTHADAEERNDGEIVRSMRDIQKEPVGFKRLVFEQLIDVKQRLTTLTDVLLPQTPRVTTPTGTGDTMMEPTTREDSPSALVHAGVSLTEASAPAGQETHDHPVLPDAQEPSDDPAEGARQH